MSAARRTILSLKRKPAASSVSWPSVRIVMEESVWPHVFGFTIFKARPAKHDLVRIWELLYTVIGEAVAPVSTALPTDHQVSFMSKCKHYGGITRAELDHLRHDLRKMQVNVPEGDDVVVDGPFGIRLQATYDEANETLKVCISEKPFFIPDSEIWKILDTGVAPYVGP